MCTVTAAVIGVISGGLSIAQQYQAVAAQNAQIKHANAQAQQNYQFQLLQNQANRTHENQKQILQDDMMLQTRFFADANHENNIAQLNTQLLQEQAATAAKKRKANREALQLMGQVRSAGRVGNTVDTLLADYRRQKEFFDYNSSRNLAFVGAQNTQRRRASQIERGSHIASQQPYLKRTILDPLKPLNAPKMKGPGVIGWLSAGAQGASAGFSAHSALVADGTLTSDSSKALLKNGQPVKSWIPGYFKV